LLADVVAQATSVQCWKKTEAEHEVKHSAARREPSSSGHELEKEASAVGEMEELRKEVPLDEN